MMSTKNVSVWQRYTDALEDFELTHDLDELLTKLRSIIDSQNSGKM